MGAAAPAPTMAAQPAMQAGATYQPMPMQPQQGFNVNQAAAGALQGAIGGTQRAMQAPLQVGAFMNPYTSEVIDRTQQDIERQRQLASQQLGARATQAGAFGGSRQGVAEGVLAGEFHYYPIDPETASTYPLISAGEAWNRLNTGNAIVLYSGDNNEEVTIREIYLAYYDPGQYAEFYQPVFVFKGDNDFYAIVPAVYDQFYTNTNN